MSVTEEIKSRLDIVDLVSEHVTLRKSGRSYAGFCPFHSNSRTPAFYVFPHTQTWRCFGACAEGGDIFSFMMKKQGWDFREALEQLARRAGVTLEKRKPVDKAQEARETRLASLLEMAADYFHMLYLHAPEGADARAYLAKRELNEETIADFRMGFALESWDACRTHFNGQGFEDDLLLSAGLLTENSDTGRRYDRFRNRLMIPIRDVNGRVVGFGARTLDPDGVPKYLNSPQTPLFDKSRIVYGLDGAKRHIREARQVVIVEGYMDVIQAWQAGFRNVVAQMGTALTEAQLRLLKRYSKRFVIALDADAAGVQATMRGLQVAREALDREGDTRFDARGLVQHEGRLQADIRVVTMPEGEDPDSIIRSGAEKWPQLLAQAQPIVEYVIGVTTAGLDLEDAKAKTAVARQVVPLIRDIAEPVERDHYWQRLARALAVDERALRQLAVPEKRRNRPPEPDPIPQQGSVPASADNQPILRQRLPNQIRVNKYFSYCLQYPELIVQVNHRLLLCQQGSVTEADFEATEDKILLRQMYQRDEGGTVATIAELCDSLEEPIQDRVQALLAIPSLPELDASRLPDELVKYVLDWRLEKVKSRSAELQRLFRDIQGEENSELAELYGQRIREAHVTILSLNKARNAVSASSRRRMETA